MLTIGQVADAAGVAPSTLRYYDEIGLLKPAGRVSGQRRYDPAAVRRMRVIDVCQAAGFSLDEIATLLDGGGDWRDVAVGKLDELDRRMAELRSARSLVEAALACGCEHLETCQRTGELHDDCLTDA